MNSLGFWQGRLWIELKETMLLLFGFLQFMDSKTKIFKKIISIFKNWLDLTLFFIIIGNIWWREIQLLEEREKASAVAGYFWRTFSGASVGARSLVYKQSVNSASLSDIL